MVIEHDDIDVSAGEDANLTRTRRRGLLLAAATQARRESRRPMQQPGGGGITYIHYLRYLMMAQE